MKTLRTALHSLLERQRAILGQKGSAEAGLWDRDVCEHVAVKSLKSQAQKLHLAKQSCGEVDILRGTLADRLQDGEARGLLTQLLCLSCLSL